METAPIVRNREVLDNEGGKSNCAAPKCAVQNDKLDQAAVVKKILKRVEQKLSGGEVKPSLGDYIRLVQLQKELDQDVPKEIKVTWVEPNGTE